MKMINAKAELISEKNPYRKVELAARTCYKSEGNITPESAERMCKGLIKSQHTAMLEHAVLCFELSVADPASTRLREELSDYIRVLSMYDFIRVTVTPVVDRAFVKVTTRVLVSANARAISERGINDPLFRAVQEKYPSLVWGNSLQGEYHLYDGRVKAEVVDIDSYTDLTEEEIGAHKTLTFRFTTDRGVSHELVRHRPCSFAQESTRYCCYSKDQFGGELTFIKPSTYDSWSENQKLDFSDMLHMTEKIYMRMVTGDAPDGTVDQPLTPQQARAILPNCLKTEIVVTANMKEWRHIFNLRVHGTTGAPHPDIKYVMAQALDIAMQDPLAAKYLQAETN